MGDDKPKSLGLKIGHAVRKCCDLSRCIAIKKSDMARKSQSQDFLLLLDCEYTDKSSPLLREMYDDKLDRHHFYQ